MWDKNSQKSKILVLPFIRFKHCNYLLGLTLIFSKDLNLQKFTFKINDLASGLPVKKENVNIILFVIEKSEDITLLFIYRVWLTIICIEISMIWKVLKTEQ